MTEQQYSQLQTQGYTIIPKFFTDQEMDDMFGAMFQLAQTVYRREFQRDIPMSPSLWLLDRYLTELMGKDPDLVGEVYDAFAYSTPFLRVISSKKMVEAIGTEAYCFTNRCRIDPPLDTRRTYGWHQGVFYTIPQAKFIQSWAPLFRPTTKENGTIEIAIGSHNEQVPRQTWEQEEGKATQILIPDEILEPYEKVAIEMEVGDLLLFSGFTAHRSGFNSSNEIRYSLVGMYHMMENTKPKWPRPDFKMRGMSQREYFDQCMGG